MPSHPDPHPDEELLAALAMDDTEDLSAEQLAHVGACAECSDAVEALRRTAVRVRASTRAEAGAPGAHLWDAVLREVQETAAPPVAPLRSSAPPRHTSRRRRSFSTPFLAAAVAVALVLGAGAGALWGRRTSSPPAPKDTLLARAELSVVGGTGDRGLAEVVRRGDHVELRVWGSHLGNGSTVHEVWLLNRDNKRLVALGMLGAGESGTFVMPARLLGEGYVVVDVSAEPDDGDPGHSGDSLARGQLRKS